MNIIRNIQKNNLLIKEILLFFILFLTISCIYKVNEIIEETYPDGSPKLVRYFKKNELLKEIIYYPNHKKQSEGEYKNNVKHGKWTFWYDNGNKWSENILINDKHDGISTTWYENGKKRYQGYYKNGEKTGVWKFWDEKGILLKEKSFDK